MSLYNLKSTGTPPLYSITKFTDDLDVEATYSVARTACDCPAGARASCRHRQMLPTLLERVDTAWFYDFDAKSWSDPTGEANKPAPGDEAEPDAGFQHVPTRDDNLDAGIDEDHADEAIALHLAEEEVAPQAEGYPTSLAPKPAPTFKRRL